MAMPGRGFSSEKYRYGFNGKEKDKDIAVGDYDFGARIYDGRIGRWLSVDPLEGKYPYVSPYCFVLNSPLLYIDPDGKDIIISEAFVNSIFWKTFLNVSFENKVIFSIQRNSANQYVLKLDMKEGEKLTSEQARKSYDYIKSVADNSKMKIYIRSGWYQHNDIKNIYGESFTPSPDSYEEAALYENVIENMQDGFDYGQKGSLFLHFLTEQVYAQFEMGYAKRDWSNYSFSHDWALNQNIEQLGYRYELSIPLFIDTRAVEDIDKIDKDGNYMGTIRRYWDFSDPQKPRLLEKTENIIRSDLKVGDKWIPAIDRIDATLEDRKKYFENNQSPGLEPPKKAKEAPKKNSKSLH